MQEVIKTTTGTLADNLGTANALRYRSYVYDTETELYYLQSRYYNPEIGRFINADAFVSTGQGLLGNNMFAYCGNNPVRYVDSSGRDFEEANMDGDPSDELMPNKDAGFMGPINSTSPTGSAFGGGGFGQSLSNALSGLAMAAGERPSGISLSTSSANYPTNRTNTSAVKPVSPKKVSDSYISQNKIDAHAFKENALGTQKGISQYDIFRDTKNNGQLWVGNKSQTVWIPTEYTFSNLKVYWGE